MNVSFGASVLVSMPSQLYYGQKLQYLHIALELGIQVWMHAFCHSLVHYKEQCRE